MGQLSLLLLLFLFYRILFLEIKKIIKRFAGMDVNKDGYITIGNFADYLRVPQDLCSKAVFSLFDPVC